LFTQAEEGNRAKRGIIATGRSFSALLDKRGFIPANDDAISGKITFRVTMVSRWRTKSIDRATRFYS